MMTIYEDTGQKIGQHDNIKRYLDAHGIKLTRVKLDTGDYCAPPRIAVDTKKGLSEVYQDLVGDHDRFHREYARAKDDGIKLYFLIEDVNGDGIRSVSDVHTWVNPAKRRGANRPSAALQKQMETVSERYGVEWVFCHPCETGRVLCELLGIEVRDGNRMDQTT